VNAISFDVEALIPISGCSYNKCKVPGTLSSNPFAPGTIIENYHDELSHIATLFLAQGSPKELNIPDSMRKQALKSISTSTSPQNLEPVALHIYTLLRDCSHRNFVRLGVSNGTFETLCMAAGLGIVLVVSGFLSIFLLAFASPSFRHCSRWRGLGVAPMWAVGAALILARMKGSCFFLLLFSRRQPLPWERFDDGNSIRTQSSGIVAFARKLMILDRKLKIKDVNLRQLQTKIVIQSIVGGVIFAALMEILFLPLPIWR
jgi:Regulator of G protein signaling domain